MQEDIELIKVKKASSQALSVGIPKKFANVLKLTPEVTVIMKLTFDKKMGRPALIIYSQDVLEEFLKTKLADDKDG